MRKVTRLGATAAVVAAGAIGGSAAVVSAHPDHGHHHGQAIRHVLLISVDGMHQSDLNWYIATHPGSELAKLASGGAEFTNNHTSDPSDSDPGGTAIMTGGDPRATGVYYDVEYSHAVDEAGAPCTPGQPATGGDVIYDSPDDKLNAVPDFLGTAGSTFPSFDADGTIYNGPNNVDKNPAAIMNMTPTPQTALNQGSFPVDPATCKPIQPWDYLKVNSIFGV
ncbi:MAG: alkaline phosphatase family protein, partial [Solirubrobacterales bacterium]|nr:alkaline phosphatase family protein [Solirubrobacterales bacterium]